MPLEISNGFYRDGKGINKDEHSAFKLASKAAKEKNYLGQFILGGMYEIGIGTEKDQVLAFAWQLKSAKQGYYLAQYNVGMMYLKGTVIGKNEEKAIEFLKRAASNEYYPSQLEVAKLLANNNQYYDSVKFYKMAINNDFEQSSLGKIQYNLAYTYERWAGYENEYDDKLRHNKDAIYWYEQALLNNYKKANCSLAQLHLLGLGGLTKDVNKAKEYKEKGKCI